MKITKSSAIAKTTDKDIKLFSKVCEKGINELTGKNTEFTKDFELSDEQQDYNLNKLSYLKNLEPNTFVKGSISDEFGITVQIVKNKAFMKCYQENKLVLEIAMSVNQLESLEDKYCYDLQRFDDTLPNQIYHLFYAGTFFLKEDLLSSKLVDLRLLKFVNVLDI